MKSRSLLAVLALGVVLPASILATPPRSKAALTPVARHSTLGPLKVTVDAQNGDKIAGERTFLVTVESDTAQINQVEFNVNGELREAKGSRPYQFTLDTLSEEEGPIDLEFRAYGSQGESGSVRVKLVVDNQIALGAEALSQKATEALQNGNTNDAILLSRAALKADRASNSAKLTLAAAYYQQGNLDKAQKFAEDVTVAQPDNAAAQDLLSGIASRRAFAVRAGMDSSEAAEVQKASLLVSVKARVRAGEARAKAFGEVTDDNRIAYSDLLIRYHRYSEAILALRPAFRKYATLPAANRLMYCYIRRGQYKDARVVLGDVKRFLKQDAYSLALEAVLLGAEGKTTDAKKVLGDAQQMNSLDPGVLTADAYLNLRTYKAASFADSVKTLSEALPNSIERLFYLHLQSNLVGDSGNEYEYFRQGIQMDSTFADFYVDRTLALLSFSRSSKVGTVDKQAMRKQAEGLLDAMLEARPDAPQILATKAMYHASVKELELAGRFAEAAVLTSSDYAGAPFVFGLVCREALVRPADARVDEEEARKFKKEEAFLLSLRSFAATSLAEKARLASDKAGQMDAVLEGRSAPTFARAITYMVTKGQIPVLAPPK